eukprot:COSAG04_NODE_263_length_18621_cov_10.926790_8_plen_246_part_00
MVELLGLGPDAASTLSLLVATLSLALSAWLLRQQRGEHVDRGGVGGGGECHSRQSSSGKATTPPPAGLLNVKAFDAVAAAPPPAGLLNVKSFGAVGDGKTDDTAAVQRALDAMTSGDTLVFPKGVYSVASTLYVGAKGGDPKYRQDGLTLTGDGVGSVILGSFRGPKWYGEHCMDVFSSRTTLKDLAFAGGSAPADPSSTAFGGVNWMAGANFGTAQNLSFRVWLANIKACIVVDSHGEKPGTGS